MSYNFTLKCFGSSRSYHPQRTYRGMTYYFRFYLDQIKYHQIFTFLMRKVGCLLNLEALFVDFMGGSIMKVDIAGVVKKRGQLQVFDYK